VYRGGGGEYSGQKDFFGGGEIPQKTTNMAKKLNCIKVINKLRGYYSGTARGEEGGVLSIWCGVKNK